MLFRMLETSFPDLSFRVLLRECSRRRDDALDEFRERVAGLLAIALVAAVPLCWTVSGSEVSLVEASEAAEPATGAKTFEAPLVNPDAVLNRLEANQLSRSDVRAVQAQLRLKGFDPGPIDGLAGKRTLSALNAYRQSISLLPVQAISRETVAGLQGQ
jgi:hypothetical protein